MVGPAQQPRDGALRRGQDVASLTDLAYGELLDAILDQRMPPGSRLVPETLAAHLGVSATPVKLALARLAAEGLVGEVARRGMFVTRLGPDELGALFDARLLLEVSAARDYGQRASADDVERLSSLAHEYRRAIEEPTPHASRAISDADRRFHRAIVELTGNEHIVRWYEQTNIHIQANRSADPRRRPETLGEHDEILDGLRSGDPAQIEHAVRAHIDNARLFAVQQLQTAGRPLLRQIRPHRL